jgi:hypothetical protein
VARRRKQCPQCVTAVTNYDGGNDEKAFGSGVGHVETVARSGKRQAWPPTNHIERLLEEACANHAYPVKQKLKDSDMMKKFMISGSLTQGMERDKDPGESDSMPFLGEDVVMTVYGGRPHQGGAACLN